MGFAPDKTAIADQCAALSAIWQSYSSLFTTGTDYSAIEAMMVEMRANGFDEVLAEVNRQYAEWCAANK